MTLSESLPKRLFNILKAAGQEFGRDMGSRFGAALSFYTLFSLVPLLFLIVAVVGFVSSDSDLTADENTICASVSADTIQPPADNPLDRAIIQVDEVAGEQISDQLAQLTCQSTANAGQALGIGLALAAFSGSSIFLHVQGILNYIFGAPQEHTSGIVNSLIQRAIALLGALLLAVLVFVPLVAVGAVNLMRDLIPTQMSWLEPLLGVAVPLASLLLLMAVVALTFRFLTRTDVSWRAARLGGMFTAVIGLLGAFGVGLYLQYFGGGGALGAVGGVAILLFFFNLMWIIYLFGAEVTKVYDDYRRHGDVMAPSQRDEKLRAAQLAAQQAADEQSEEAEDQPSPVTTGIMAFLIGLATGWAARRRG